MNQKKLLEKFSTIEAALNVLVRECKEAKKELGGEIQPVRNSLRTRMNDQIQRALVKREQALERSQRRKQLNSQL